MIVCESKEGTNSATNSFDFDEDDRVRIDPLESVTGFYEDARVISARPIPPLSAKKLHDLGRQIAYAQESTNTKYIYFVSISREDSGAARNDAMVELLPTVEVRLFLHRVYRLCRQGFDRMAMDEIMNFFDDALIEGDTVKCGKALEHLDPERLNASMMLVALHITGKAKAWLGSFRDDFYSRAVTALAKERGRQQAERLLSKHR